MTEAEMETHIRRICAQLGLWVYHTYNSVGSDKGWPDLVIGGSRLLFRELKSRSGVLTAEQRDMGWKLKNAGADWRVWWPKDLHNGNVERELGAIAGRVRETLP